MILHVPVRKVKVRVDGAEREVLELAAGFVHVTPDIADPAYGGVSAASGRFVISNPLIESFMDFYNRGQLGRDERVFIALEEQPYSNPLTDDELASLSTNDVVP